LVEQERVFTKALGGLLPEHPDLDRFLAPLQRVLDVACGSGAWALSLAQAYPHLQVEGFDIDERMIKYANTQARAGRLENARFRVLNALDPLDYPADSFDVVNVRFMAVLPAAAWPRVMRELVRITRPGGIVRLTEAEAYSLTNSPAFETLSGMFLQAFKRAGHGFSPDGRNSGLTPMLRPLLEQAGCQNVQIRPFVIDWSAGREAHEAIRQDITVFTQLLQPFIVGTGVTTQEEIERLHREADAEMLGEDFCALLYFLTAWGEKPRRP
jgi:ubiquinone/menaquinone biosynthesis C-methylase UbiE